MLETDARLALITEWLSRELRLPPVRASSRPRAMPVSGVTSARSCAGGTYIVMDAPPDKEDVRPVPEGRRGCSRRWDAHVPHVHESDSRRGDCCCSRISARTLYLERLDARR